MSKIYLSRSISRTLSADHPVGDPTGGAAYGEKNDPVSALLSVAAMSSSYVATGMTLMQGLTFAGGALSLVGNVTGNKTLSKIGMVAGIAGGLGQAGLFGQTAKNATLSGTFGGSTASSGATGGSVMASKSGPLSQSTDLADETAAANQSAATQKAKIADASGNVRGTAGMGYGQTASGTTASPTNLPNSGSSYTSNAYNQSLGAEAYADAGLKSATEPGFFSKAWEGTKELASGLNPVTNPYGAMAVGQIAAPIAEYLSGKTDAEIAALEASTRANEANAGFADERTKQLKEEIAREKMRRANLNAGYTQVDTGISVNPNASMTRQGLIAQQLQQV